MSVAFETARELRSFLSVYAPTLQSFRDFSKSNPSGNPDYQSELTNFTESVSTEELQVLAIYMHVGNALTQSPESVLSLPEDDLFRHVHKVSSEIGWVFDPDVSDSQILSALKGYPNDRTIFERLSELPEKFTID